MDPYLPDLARSGRQPALRARTYDFLLRGRAAWYAGRRWVWTDKRYGEGRLEPEIGTRPLTDPPPLGETLCAALADPSAAVRRVAGDVLIERRGEVPDVLALARALSGDPYPSLAERGRFVLAKLDGSAEI